MATDNASADGTRVVVELTVLEAFQVVSALEYRQGYLEGLLKSWARQRGDADPSESEATVAAAYGFIQRATRAVDDALMTGMVSDPSDDRPRSGVDATVRYFKHAARQEAKA